MSDVLDLGGVTLTLDECKAVLAWVDDPLRWPLDTPVTRVEDDS